MDCLEFRRQLGADPRRESAEMKAHRLDCPGCSEGQARALGFELQLRRALAVPAPAGLADRILLAQTTTERRHSGVQRRRWGKGLAIAAGVLLVVAAGGLWRVRTAEAFPNLMVDHLKHEPEAFASRESLPADTVQQRFDKRGVRLAAALPPGISYVSACPIGPYKSVHMVMPEQEGPVTVIYIADHRERQRDDFQHGVWQGRSVPMGQGTLVMVAQNGHMFDALEQSWRHTIEGGINAAVGAP
jgi:hypothetical protein